MAQDRLDLAQLQGSRTTLAELQASILTNLTSVVAASGGVETLTRCLELDSLLSTEGGNERRSQSDTDKAGANNNCHALLCKALELACGQSASSDVVPLLGVLNTVLDEAERSCPGLLEEEPPALEQACRRDDEALSLFSAYAAALATRRALLLRLVDRQCDATIAVLRGSLGAIPVDDLNGRDETSEVAFTRLKLSVDLADRAMDQCANIEAAFVGGQASATIDRVATLIDDIIKQSTAASNGSAEMLLLPAGKLRPLLLARSLMHLSRARATFIAQRTASAVAQALGEIEARTSKGNNNTSASASGAGTRYPDAAMMGRSGAQHNGINDSCNALLQRCSQLVPAWRAAALNALCSAQDSMRQIHAAACSATSSSGSNGGGPELTICVSSGSSTSSRANDTNRSSSSSGVAGTDSTVDVGDVPEPISRCLLTLLNDGWVVELLQLAHREGRLGPSVQRAVADAAPRFLPGRSLGWSAVGSHESTDSSAFAEGGISSSPAVEVGQPRRFAVHAHATDGRQSAGPSSRAASQRRFPSANADDVLNRRSSESEGPAVADAQATLRALPSQSQQAPAVNDNDASPSSGAMSVGGGDSSRSSGQHVVIDNIATLAADSGIDGSSQWQPSALSTGDTAGSSGPSSSSGAVPVAVGPHAYADAFATLAADGCATLAADETAIIDDDDCGDGDIGGGETKPSGMNEDAGDGISGAETMAALAAAEAAATLPAMSNHDDDEEVSQQLLRLQPPPSRASVSSNRAASAGAESTPPLPLASTVGYAGAVAPLGPRPSHPPSGATYLSRAPSMPPVQSETSASGSKRARNDDGDHRTSGAAAVIVAPLPSPAPPRPSHSPAAAPMSSKLAKPVGSATSSRKPKRQRRNEYGSLMPTEEDDDDDEDVDESDEDSAANVSAGAAPILRGAVLNISVSSDGSNGSNNTSSGAVRTPAPAISVTEARRRLSLLTVPELQQLLALNGMRKSAKDSDGKGKEGLVNRCVDAVAHGTLPRCPWCKQGYVEYADASRRTLKCPGGFDPDRRAKTECGYAVDNAPGSRPTWRWH